MRALGGDQVSLAKDLYLADIDNQAQETPWADLVDWTIVTLEISIRIVLAIRRNVQLLLHVAPPETGATSIDSSKYCNAFRRRIPFLLVLWDELPASGMLIFGLEGKKALLVEKTLMGGNSIAKSCDLIKVGRMWDLIIAGWRSKSNLDKLGFTCYCGACASLTFLRLILKKLALVQ